MSFGVAGVIANPEESNIFQFFWSFKKELHGSNNLQNIILEAKSINYFVSERN